MYAVFKTGGKQHRVSVGQTLKVEKLVADENAAIAFDEVLMVGDVANSASLKVGAPLVSGASIQATVLSHGRHKKIKIIKFKRRKHHMKQMGHRQDYTELRIDKIVA